MKTKSRENILIIKDFYRALSNGDTFYARTALDPDIEWTEPSPEVLAFGGKHSGMEGVFKEVIEVIHDRIRQFDIKPRKFFAVGDMVAVLGHSTGRGRLSDHKLIAPTVHLWTLRNGKAVKFQAFHDLAAWETALGLGAIGAKELAA
jgi:ketosteroid isomerase-like protein